MTDRIQKVVALAKEIEDNLPFSDIRDSIDFYLSLSRLRSDFETISVQYLNRLNRAFPDSFEPDYYLSQYFLYLAQKPHLARDAATRALKKLKAEDDEADFFRKELRRVLGTGAQDPSD